MTQKMQRPYIIHYAYDTETTNIPKEQIAIPILHQVGYIANVTVLTPENVEQEVILNFYRTTEQVFAFFDFAFEQADTLSECHVVMVHNLSFDAVALTAWLIKHNLKVSAKSGTKVLKIEVLNESDEACLCFIDTEALFAQSLAACGREIGYNKLDLWDYTLSRTPETELTSNELEYAAHDIYVLCAYMAFWLKLNQIDENDVGRKIISSTGVVRHKRYELFSSMKRSGSNKDLGYEWLARNAAEEVKTPEEFYTTHACTRGGFTFTAGRYASVPIEQAVIGADAISMHPAQMLSHFYPIDFHESNIKWLSLAAKTVCATNVYQLLKFLKKPFRIAFNACFRFHSLRLRGVFARDEIGLLARDRFQGFLPEWDNAETRMFENDRKARGYKDVCKHGKFAFGKLISADMCEVFITELELWNMSQVYEWDSMEPVFGYSAAHWVRPTDFSILSVLHFYEAKNAFKQVKKLYSAGSEIPENLLQTLSKTFGQDYINAIRAHELSETDMQILYQKTKAYLNALYGIEITNEAKPEYRIVTTEFLQRDTKVDFERLPEKPKTWVQFGQRIVGWSRVAQVATMVLLGEHTEGIVCGDTDSIKFIPRNKDMCCRALSAWGNALRNARLDAAGYTCYYFGLKTPDDIGCYEIDTVTDRFCVAGNKHYILRAGQKYKVVIAGIATGKKGLSFAGMINSEHVWTFKDICDNYFGYNLVVTSDLSGCLLHTMPNAGVKVSLVVTDWKGDTCTVCEYPAPGLFNQDKVLLDIMQPEIAENLKYALRNNPNVRTDPRVLSKHGIVPIGEAWQLKS